MTNHPRAALVYTTGGQAGIDELMPVCSERKLFVLDRRWEQPEFTHLACTERPVLRILLYFARTAADPLDGDLTRQEVVSAERERITFLVCADLEDLGRTAAEQAAVVGLLLECGISVVAAGEIIDERHYLQLLRAAGGFAAAQSVRQALDEVRTDLMGLEPQQLAYQRCLEATVGLDAGQPDPLDFLLMTSRLNTYQAATPRAVALRAQGMVPDCIAAQLRVEGYRNQFGSRVWSWTSATKILNAYDAQKDDRRPDVD